MRHDLDYVPCDDWHVRNPSRSALSGELPRTGRRRDVPRVLNLHMQNRFPRWLMGGLSTVPGDLLIRMDFSVYFLRSLLDGLMHEFVILTERWIYLSLCLLLQWKWPLNVQRSSILSISSPREGVTFCLCFATHEYMLTSTRARIRVCSWTYVYARICVCSRLYKLKIQYIWKHMFSLSVFSYLWGARNRCYLCWIQSICWRFFCSSFVRSSHCCQML